jgi:hypothetical protein
MGHARDAKKANDKKPHKGRKGKDAEVKMDFRSTVRQSNYGLQRAGTLLLTFL